MTSIGIDADCRDGFVYWSDMTSKTIKKADFEGQRVSTIVKYGLGSPEGIAVDWIGRNVYWTDSQLDTIEVVKMKEEEEEEVKGDGNDILNDNNNKTDSNSTRTSDDSNDSNMFPRRKILVNTGLVNPRAITVHPSKGKLFWADWNRRWYIR